MQQMLQRFGNRNRITIKKEIIMKTKGLVGIILVTGCLLKIATLTGLIHIVWLERVESWETYFSLFILLYVGLWLIFDSIRSNRDLWIQRPIPRSKEGQRIDCAVSFGGDEYTYNGEPFHGARLVTKCGGIRMDLRNAKITKDEEIDISTFMGGVELFVPTSVNIEVKSRSFIGGVGNETLKSIHPDAPCLHIVASNILGGVSVRN